MDEPTQQYSDAIRSLQSRIKALENENRLLKERLEEAGVSFADIVSDDAEGVVELYDLRYSNPKRGRTGIIRSALTAGIVAAIYRKRMEFVVRIAN